MKLRELGEFAFIERIREKAASSPDLVLGIGDDCAAGRVPPGHLLLTTTDLLLEDIHFRRDWTDLHALGRKSVSVNVSDLAAMGGRPTALFLAVGIPDDLALEELDRFTAGVLAACADYGAVLAGGDTCRSPRGLFISVTAEGVVTEEAMVTRGGARPGDLLWVSGTLGDSALALRELSDGRRPPPELAARHHDPAARVPLGRALAGGRLASAMIDVSDGVLADLGHILDSSGVGARIESARLPLSPALRQALDKDDGAIDLALAGGEDYELLFASPPAAAAAVRALSTPEVPLTQIGRLVPARDGLKVLDVQGRERLCSRSGFNHFA